MYNWNIIILYYIRLFLPISLKKKFLNITFSYEVCVMFHRFSRSWSPLAKRREKKKKMSTGGRLSSAYLLGRTNNRFSRAYTRVCIRGCFFGVCIDACIRRDPFVTSGQVFVCTRGHRCFEQWKYHSRTEERGYRTLCSRFLSSTFELYLSPVGKNYQSIVRLRFYSRLNAAMVGKKLFQSLMGL